jgi:hypothetical protein
MNKNAMHLKLSDTLHAAIVANAEATSRCHTEVVCEAVHQYLLRNPLTRDSLFDAVISPYIGRLIRAEATIGTMQHQIDELKLMNPRPKSRL